MVLKQTDIRPLHPSAHRSSLRSAQRSDLRKQPSDLDAYFQTNPKLKHRITDKLSRHSHYNLISFHI